MLENRSDPHDPVAAQALRPTHSDPPRGMPLGLGGGGFALIAQAGDGEDLPRAADRALAAGASALQVDAGRLGDRPDGRPGPLPVVAVVRRPQDLAAAGAADVLRVDSGAGVRLSGRVARSGRPVLLDAGPGAHTGRWLEAAGRLADLGVGEVALCASATGGTGPVPHLGVIPLVRRTAGRPLVVDATRPAAPDAAAALARAAAAAGADGVVVRLDLVEAADGARREPPPPAASAFGALARELDELAAVLGRRLQRRRIRYVGGTAARPAPSRAG
jgi:hypothetical protein